MPLTTYERFSDAATEGLDGDAGVVDGIWVSGRQRRRRAACARVQCTVPAPLIFTYTEYLYF